MEIITDISFLKTPCKEVSVQEGKEIGKQLLEFLKTSEDGIGLAANQVGIDACVCVINVTEPIVLINPKILNTYDETITFESCLSFPGQTVRTKRYEYVSIITDNIGSVVFGPCHGNDDERNKTDILESVCVQHEIAHLNGKTMYDFEYKLEPVKARATYGRNERVEITNGKELKTLKWKKAEPLVNSGEWEVYIGGPIT